MVRTMISLLLLSYGVNSYAANLDENTELIRKAKSTSFMPLAAGILTCAATSVTAYILYSNMIDQPTDIIEQEAIAAFMAQTNITGSTFWGTTIPYGFDPEGGPLPLHFKECLSLPSYAVCSFFENCSKLDPNDTSSCFFNCNATRPNQSDNVLIHGSVLDMLSVVHEYCGCQISYWNNLAQQGLQHFIPESRTLQCDKNEGDQSLCCGHIMSEGDNFSMRKLYVRIVYGNGTEAAEDARKAFITQIKNYAAKSASIFSGVGAIFGFSIMSIPLAKHLFGLSACEAEK